ncbi:MAG: sulfatase-like hydrolase/transferase, partial [Planctomycetota bacterium]|nr:sulfatase-like hydrolase/transferase [Planctomycetota bacterium]
MSTLRFVLLFLLGFVLLPICDGFLVLSDRQEGRALATLLSLALLGLPLALLVRLGRPLFERLLPARLRVSAALPMAAGLALALVPQLAPLLPGKSLGGRFSFHPFWAPVSTLAGLAVVIAVLGRALPRMPMRTGRLAALVLLAWGGVAAFFGWQDARAQHLLLSAQYEPAGEARAPQEPDVTLIVLDTLRDGGLLGAWMDQDLMPFARATLADARSFSVSYSASNCTPPGHSAMFTGMYPAESGTLPKGHIRLPAENTTLAEYLRKFGYRTLSVVSNTRLDSILGFAQGFEVWDDSLVVDPTGHYYAFRRVANASVVRAIGGKRLMMRLKALADRTTSANQHDVTAQMTSARVGAVLDEALGNGARTEPVHLFVNYIDPHMPYQTRTDLASAFLPNVEDAVMEAARPSMPALLEQLLKLSGRLEDGVDPAQDPELARRLTWIEEAYWEQCRQLDEGLRDLFEHLRRHGLMDPEDLVVLTSDHGEELGEHPKFGHGTALFEASVRVPLLLLGGGFPAGEDTRVVSGIDLFPTVLIVLGIDEAAWPSHLAGYPLQGPIPEDRIARFESGGLRGFVSGRRKMIATDHGDRLEWTHAFDLIDDPRERRN